MMSAQEPIRRTDSSKGLPRIASYTWEGEMGKWSEIPHVKVVRPLNIPRGQMTVPVRTRSRSKGK